jgi:hypothetical protein
MSIPSHWPAPREGRRLASHAFPAMKAVILFAGAACFTWLSLLYYPCVGGKSAFDIT